MPSQIVQGVSSIRKMHTEIKEKMTQTFKDFNAQLRVDSLRLQELETKVRPVPEIEKQMKILDAEMGTIRLCDKDLYQVKHFIQRELPLLIHLQLCEGLDVVSGSFLSELKVFEKKKLQELLTYYEDSKGVRIDIGDFGDRIRDYGHFLKDTDRGFFPFTLGKGHDYWAEMTYGLPIRLSI